jgi:hypothetical protein
MTMLRLLRRLGLFGFLCLGIAGRASAEPIQVTAGSAFMYWDGSGSFATLLGSGLNVVTDTFGGGLIGFNAGTAQLDGGVTFGTLGGMQHPWNVTVGGTDYVAYLDGSLSFDTDPFIAPPPTGSTSSSVTFSTPFTMNGRLRGSSGPQGSGALLFDVELTGSGTATTVARPIVPDVYLVNSGVNYELGAATPEPATLLLMGTGLAGVFLRRRTSRKSS